MNEEKHKELVREVARNVIRIEKNCLYGDEPEHGRLKKIRQSIQDLHIKKRNLGS